MLDQARIPLTEKEQAAIEKLLAKHPDQNASLMRRDPGEAGPVLVHIDEDSYEVSEAGETKKLKAAN